MRTLLRHRLVRVLVLATPGVIVAAAVLTVTNGSNMGGAFVVGLAAGVIVSSALFLVSGVAALQAMNTELHEANIRISTMSEELQEAYQETLQAFASALDARDTDTHGHSVRVVRLSLAIAEQLTIQPDSETWRALKYGALLHDVGKIGVPDAILQKTGTLTTDEWRSMREHPARGHAMLQQVRFLRGGPAEVAFCHHEQYDGSGYPRGLTGAEIPLPARIFAVADAFDAMTARRPYRQHLGAEQAYQEIRRCSGTQFDPQVVEAFLRLDAKQFVAAAPPLARAA